MTNKLALVVAIALGVLSILGIRSYVANLETEVRISGEKTPFLVFRDDIQAGRVLNADDVVRKDFQTLAITEALRGSEITESKLQAYIGRRLRSSVKAGQILTQDYFDGATRAESPTKKLDPADRLVSIPVDNVSSVSGLIRPGDFIDVVSTMPVADRASRGPASATFTVLQNVPVVATGSTTDPAGVGRGETFATITVSVSGKDVNKVVYLIHNQVPYMIVLRPGGAPKSPSSNPVVADQLTNDAQRDLNR